MKKLILTIFLILALLLSACTPTTKPNQTTSEMPFSQLPSSETISEQSSDMVSRDESLDLTPNGVAIKTLLDYFNVNQAKIVDLNSWKYDGFELAFQNVTGDDIPEMLVRIMSDKESVGNEIIVYGLKDGQIERNFQLDFLETPTKDRRQGVVRRDGDYFVKLEYSYSNDAIYFWEHGGGYKNMTPDVYIDYVKADLREIHFNGVAKHKEYSLLFSTYKTPHAEAFFEYILTDNHYNRGENEEFSLSRCQPYFNKETGLYETYVAGKIAVETVLGKENYSKEIKDQIDLGYELIEVTKAEYERIYVEFFALFEEVKNPIYRSGLYNKVDVDYDKILNEAIAFFD